MRELGGEGGSPIILAEVGAKNVVSDPDPPGFGCWLVIIDVLAENYGAPWDGYYNLTCAESHKVIRTIPESLIDHLHVRSICIFSRSSSSCED